ncbi:hypothetical protein HD554DRAFT_2027295 [Boletus coccyginus]|nr:hypothetical protein HD554DRAFT_2027295 [Boletus coccyginus]
MSFDELELKTVAILGGSYGGNRAARVLAAGLPSGWRVVLVDRNSHFNHVYNFPRYTVLPGHEHKAFIPYDNMFSNPSDPSCSAYPYERIHGMITSLHSHHITYTPYVDAGLATSTLLGSPFVETTEKILRFDYAIYALGSHLPSPIDLWGSGDIDPFSAQEPLCPDTEGWPQCISHTPPYMGTKQESISRLRSRQQKIETARQVLVVGGGALGIQFASDIAAVYPRKRITLLHSRSRLLPRFDMALGDEVYQGLQELGVHIILSDRLDVSSLNGKGIKEFGNQETMVVKTLKGCEIEADLVLLCTGQIPNTSLLHTMDSNTIDPKSRMVRVSRTMQILALREKDTTLLLMQSRAPLTFVYPHLFAIGDAADAFGAIKAGHTAYYQGELAARNVIKLIQGDAGTLKAPLQPSAFTPDAGEMEVDSRGAEEDSEGKLELEEYVPTPPMIRVSLGLTKSAYEVAGAVGTENDGIEDLGAADVWRRYGYEDIDEDGMRM